MPKNGAILDLSIRSKKLRRDYLNFQPEPGLFAHKL